MHFMCIACNDKNLLAANKEVFVNGSDVCIQTNFVSSNKSDIKV